MRRFPSKREKGILVAVLVTLGGIVLPWVRKRPAGYTDGEPFYTDEWVWGLSPGVETLDLLLIAPAVSIVLVLVLLQNRALVRDAWVLVASVPILWYVGRAYSKYQRGSTYAVEPGLYLLLLGGGLLVLLGASGLVVSDRRQSDQGTPE